MLLRGARRPRGRRRGAGGAFPAASARCPADRPTRRQACKHAHWLFSASFAVTRFTQAETPGSRREIDLRCRSAAGTRCCRVPGTRLCGGMQHLQQRGHARPGPQRARCVRARCSAAPRVIVTREHGKNGKLVKELAKHGVQCLEMPLIEHAPGPDRQAANAVCAPPPPELAAPTARALHDAACNWVRHQERGARPSPRTAPRSGPPLQVPAAAAAAARGL